MNELQDPIKIEIIELKPNRIKVRFLSTQTEVEFSKSFFDRRMEFGIYEVVNLQLLPSVI